MEIHYILIQQNVFLYAVAVGSACDLLHMNCTIVKLEKFMRRCGNNQLKQKQIVIT